MSVMRLDSNPLRPARAPRTASLAVLVLALGLGGCETLSSINPFDRPEKYTPEVTVDTAAD